MKILITGAAGFIASHLADACIAAGHEVVILDNLRTGYKRNLNPQAKFYNIDICDPAVEEIFAREKPDIVDHHAAQISVPLSIEDPLTDAEINVKGLINILQAASKHQVKKVVYISSGGAMYGEADEYPTSETYNPRPLSVYAINKMVGEDYLYFEAFGQPQDVFHGHCFLGDSKEAGQIVQQFLLMAHKEELHGHAGDGDSLFFGRGKHHKDVSGKHGDSGHHLASLILPFVLDLGQIVLDQAFTGIIRQLFLRTGLRAYHSPALVFGRHN